MTQCRRRLVASHSEGQNVRRSVTLRAGLGLLAGVPLFAGCSQETAAQFTRWGMPVAASDRAHDIGTLWNGAWAASMVVGVLVWGLIFYAIIRFRRKSPGDVPRQSQYNLPMEILYTIVPVLIIGVLFVFTYNTQNRVLTKVDQPDVQINVIGQKWSWTFNYMEQNNPQIGDVVWDAGTIEKIPDLWLPVNKTVRFKLDSADVIHSFWVPEFYFKLDVIPGHTNTFDVTPTRLGDYHGKCAELCGTYHAAMLFTVHIVDQATYEAKLKELKAKGQTGEIKVPVSVTAVPVPPKK